MAIIHPLKPRMGAGLVLTVIAVIWVVSVAIAFPNLVYAEIYTFNGTDVTVCYLKWPDGESGGPSDFAYVGLMTSLLYCNDILRHSRVCRLGNRIDTRQTWWQIRKE